MKALLDRINSHARLFPAKTALQGDGRSISYCELNREISKLSDIIPAGVTGIFMQNCPEWVIADLAILKAGLTCVPLPLFFTNDQLSHVISDSGMQQVITDAPEKIRQVREAREVHPVRIGDKQLFLMAFDNRASTEHLGIDKITYTSGTSGSPKGVCLDGTCISRVMNELCVAGNASDQDASLALLPLSTLLENIGGVYVPLLTGATCIIPTDNERGMNGSSGININRLLSCIDGYRPSTMILIPQLLHAMVAACDRGWQLPGSVRFIAVGGAKTSRAILDRAVETFGMPVYEGYGLSEAGSVISLNSPQHCRTGSVGRVLPHVQVEIGDDNEIIIHGHLFNGYLNGHSTEHLGSWHTGDTGYLDADGFLYLTGRKRDIYCTSFGRNVDPAWVETELTGQDAILQAAVFGDGRPFNTAVIVPRTGAGQSDIHQAIQRANTHLPDYAQVRNRVIADTPFTMQNGLSTLSGVPVRDRIEEQYRHSLDTIYQEARQA